MTNHSIPSFDHLQSIDQPHEQDRYRGSLVEAQIRRNGQMKYQRTTQAADPHGEDIVMPDGEIISPSSR